LAYDNVYVYININKIGVDKDYTNSPFAFDAYTGSTLTKFSNSNN